MNFAEIIGQEDAKNLLKNAIKTGTISHAYIFSGEEGSGKMMLAEAFATMLLCEEPGDDACGQCHSCKQSISHNNPDIIYVKRDEDKKAIGVDVVREQINNDIVLKPYSGKYKVYIVDEAEKMNPQAQNALLKTIEEPPAYAILLLLTSNHNSLLQTILSRCITVQMKTIPTEQIVKLLMQKYQIVDYQAQVAASFAQGNIGKAIDLAGSEAFNQLKYDMLNVVRKAENMDEYELSEQVKLLASYKSNTDQMLDLMTLWYRDVLLYKATQAESRLLFQENIYDIKEQAEQSTYEGIDKIFETIEETRRRLQANVNYELSIELLLQALKENTR